MKRTTIKATGMSKFSAALHTNFHQALYSLITALPTPEQKTWRLEALLTEYKESIQTEVDINKESASSQNTKDIAQLDEQRDRLISYIFGQIRLDYTCGILPTRQEAADRLMRIVKTYNGLQKKGYQEQTAQTDGLIHDLQKTQEAKDIKMLGLDTLVSQLKSVNEQFHTTHLTRTLTAAQTKLPTSSAQRKITAEIFQRLTKRIEGAFDFMDTDSERERINFLISQMNAIINDYRARHNRATGTTAPKGKDDKGGTTDSTDKPKTGGVWDDPAPYGRWEDGTPKVEGE